MKKIPVILFLTLLTACAAKEPPFDPVAVFREAEDNMRKEYFDKARKGYQELQEKSPDKSYDAVLMLRVADSYYGEEKYDEALVEYQAFLNYHPVHKDAAYAQYQIAMCSYNSISTIDRDPSPTRTAIKEFEKLTQKYPASGYEEQARKYTAVCRDKLAEYEFYVGRFYHKKGSYKAAVGRLEKLLADYPGSSAEKETLYYLGLSYMELGERGQAGHSFETLMNKYPSMHAAAVALLAKLRTE